jgi:hypothetical protein
MPFNKKLHVLQDKIFDTVLYITYILYIAVALGLSANAPQYLDELQYYIKLYISLFLIYRFNPFRHVRFTGLDVKIAFNAGWFLLTTTVIDSFLKTYLNTFKEYLEAIRFV